MLQVQYNLYYFISMNEFFKKYKGLFQVNDNVIIPTTRLTLNHNLFIDQPYLPAYTQQYKLNNKLIDLRKEYSSLDSQIQQISANLKNIRQPQKFSPKLLKLQNSKRLMRPISNRFSNILQPEKTQIKKNQIDNEYRFKQRVDDAYIAKTKITSPIIDNKNIQLTRLPKIQLQNRQPSLIFNQSQIERVNQQELGYKESKPTKLNYREAMRHRKDASKRIQERKQKLRKLLNNIR